MADNGIFSSLDKLGLGMLSDMNLYEDEKQTSRNVVQNNVAVNKKLMKKICFSTRHLSALYAIVTLNQRLSGQEKQE